MINLTWNDFKSVSLAKGLAIQYVDVDNRLILWTYDGSMTFTCIIQETDTVELEDFETSYQPTANQPVKSQVITQFERDDLVLKLTSKTVAFGESDECEAVFLVPGTFDPQNASRYIAGGYANSDAYKFGDRVTAAEIVDIDGVIFPANTVLATYHDEEAPAEEQGWRMWATDGGEGECEIEPLGGYGHLPGQMYLRIKFKKVEGSPATQVCANILWGIKE